MQLIEPCCAPKHLLTLRENLGESGTAFFHGYGDLSLAEILPALLIRYCETEMTIVVPSLPDPTADAILSAMEKTRAKMTGNGNLNVIAHLTLVSNFSERRSPMASEWVSKNPFGERMTLKNVQQNDTAILLPDIALWGPMNLSYGGHFTALATKSASAVESLRKMYEGLR